jgi:hypothetical protein
VGFEPTSYSCQGYRVLMPHLTVRCWPHAADGGHRAERIHFESVMSSFARVRAGCTLWPRIFVRGISRTRHGW